MSRKKFIIGLSIGFSLLSLLIIDNLHKKTYDEAHHKDIRKLVSFDNTNITMAYLNQNKEKALSGSLPDNIEELMVEKLKELEMKKSKEKEADKGLIVAERKINEPIPNRGSDGAKNREHGEIPKGYLNSYVLSIIKTYPIGSGNYPYLLNNDYENYNGVTEDIYYKGELLLKAHPSGTKYSHCSGITFEVFFKAMRKRNEELGKDLDDINGMTKEELYDFIMTWYVANGPKSESNLAVALEKYGLGKRIANKLDLRPGDFIDFTRENNTGHSAVFINWIKEGDRIIGLKYWSSQESTKGIGYKEEYFNIADKNGNKYGSVIIDSLHMARAK